MREILDYNILRASTARNLVDLTLDMMNQQGFEPMGAPFTSSAGGSGEFWYQAIVKYKSEAS